MQTAFLFGLSGVVLSDSIGDVFSRTFLLGGSSPRNDSLH